MSREFARSSPVSMWAGSARNDTTAKATPKGNSASRNTGARTDLRRVPTALALRIEGSYSTPRQSVRGGANGAARVVDSGGAGGRGACVAVRRPELAGAHVWVDGRLTAHSVGLFSPDFRCLA